MVLGENVASIISIFYLLYVLELLDLLLYNVAIMFMQKTTCKRGKATYFTFLVRQSFRIPEGPRSRTVCNVTKLPPHIRELIAQGLRGRELVDLESLELSEAQSFGGLAVLRRAWDDFGLDNVLATRPWPLPT